MYEGTNFILKKPAKWLVQKKNEQQIAFFGPKVGHYNAAIFLNILKNRKESYSDISLLALNAKQKVLADFNIIEKQEIKGDYPSLLMKLTWRDENSNCLMHAMEMYTQWEDSIFVLSSSVSDSQQTKKWENFFSSIFKSFKIMAVPTI